MPANYVQVNALVFALFGKKSDKPKRDLDLDLSLSNDQKEGRKQQ